VRRLANHGMQVRYRHDEVGINSRLDTLQAAVLRVKLRHLDRYCAARIAAADRYDALFAGMPGVRTPYRDPRATHVFHQYTLRLLGIDRDALVRHLADRGIPTGVYYPIPGHRQPAFAGFHFDPSQFPISEALSREVLSLPMHTELTADMQQYIADAVAAFLVPASLPNPLPA